MTEEEFYESLSATRGVFRWVFAGEKIRSYHGASTRCDCPITAVAQFLGHGTFGPGQYQQAARALGIDEVTASLIADAADCSGSRKINERRNRILRACGFPGEISR